MTKALYLIDTDTHAVVPKGARKDRDWPEDFAHENGQYFCTCSVCDRQFTGHKRRVVCKLCTTAPQPTAATMPGREDIARTLFFSKHKRFFVDQSNLEKAWVDCPREVYEQFLNMADAILALLKGEG